MFEKVNPAHPDKVADRIAGAVVDLAYAIQENPRVAVEVLIGHGVCHAIVETSAPIREAEVAKAIARIAGNVAMDIRIVPQDEHLARNQEDLIRCGDNGIFKGVPVTREQRTLSDLARELYEVCPYDGKFILDAFDLIICQVATVCLIAPIGSVAPVYTSRIGPHGSTASFYNILSVLVSFVMILILVFGLYRVG